MESSTKVVISSRGGKGDTESNDKVRTKVLDEQAQERVDEELA